MRRYLILVLAMVLGACADDEESSRAGPEEGPSTTAGSLSAASAATETEPRYETRGESVYLECDGGACELGARNALSTMPRPAETASRPSKLVAMQAISENAGEESKNEVLAVIANETLSGVDRDRVRFKVWLWEDEWDFAELRRARRDVSQRLRVIDSRRNLLSISQAEVTRAVRSVGGEVLATRWLTNSLLVEVPRWAVEEILDHPLVFGAYLPSEGSPTVAGDGYDRRFSFHPIGITETGQINVSDTIVIGVVENTTNGDGSANTLNTAHVGWRDTAGGVTRVISTKQCGTSSCSSGGSGSVVTHGTVVTSVAAGSIEEGQDAAFPGSYTASQRRRSGVANEASVRYYRPLGGSDYLETAIETAVGDGVDVLNMSFKLGNSCADNCNNSYDPSGIRADLAAAEDAGVVLFAAAGNDGETCSGQCSTVFPATHPDVIAAAALNDTNGVGFEGAGVAPWSSGGGIVTQLFGGYVAQIPSIGLITFGTVRLAFNGGNNQYSPLFDSGTSFASPQLASLGALFRQWMMTNNINLNDFAWCIGVNTLLMGDGSCGASCSLATTISGSYGLGFPRYFVPTTEKLGAYGGWGTRVDVIDNGETLAWEVGGPGPESNFVNGWKFAMAVDATGTSNLPDLDVRVVDKCPAGGGTVTIRAAPRGGTRFRMNISDPNLIRGKCLEVRVTGTHVKAGGDVFWAADYYFSTPTSRHLYVP